MKSELEGVTPEEGSTLIAVWKQKVDLVIAKKKRSLESALKGMLGAFIWTWNESGCG